MRKTNVVFEEESTRTRNHLKTPWELVGLNRRAAPQLETSGAAGTFPASGPAGRIARLAPSGEEPLRRTREEQALVARAKRVLMENSGLTEQQAHRLLQKRSMDHGSRLADTARKVLEEISQGIGG